MRIHCLQHVPFEGPAAVAAWAEERGHALTVTHVYRDPVPPSPEGFDWLLIMGGPMGANDDAEHPWLVAEKALLRECLRAGKVMIGICLGAQLLADALDARVYRAPQKEIGWFPIDLTDAGASNGLLGPGLRRIQAFHWHGDTFDLPPGSTRIASSAVCENQAFLHQGRVLGLQFHIESTPESVQALISNCRDEIQPAAYIQGEEEMLSAHGEVYRKMHAALFHMLDRLG